jgi:calcineurin-like phosphoesterase family protein
MRPPPTDPTITRRQALAALAGITAPLVLGCRGLDLLGPKASFDLTDVPVTLIGGGDQHALCLCNAHKVAKLVQAQLIADPAAIAFALGDLVQNGLATEYHDWYETSWGAFKDRTLFLMGNHDRKADPTGTAYWDYVAGLQSGERGKGYYAKTLGSWRCYFLNTQMVRSEQAAWLAADLPEWSGTHHIMAMWHIPMWGSPTVKQGLMTWPGPKGVGTWWKLLEQHGAEFVVSGHVHWWERFQRKLTDGTVSDLGIRQFINGNGGGTMYAPVIPRDPASEVQHSSRGVARFRLYSDHYEWNYSDLTGVVRDSGTQLCRGGVR